MDIKKIIIGVALASVIGGAGVDVVITEQKIDDLQNTIVEAEGHFALSVEDLETFGLSKESAEKLSYCFDNNGELDINDRHLIGDYVDVVNKAMKLTRVKSFGLVEKDKEAKKFNYLITEAAKIKRTSLFK